MFRLPWQPIRFSGFEKIHMIGRRLLKEHFWKTCRNICNEIEIKAYFHSSHDKSIETISCHSDESKWAIAIKNIVFVEANVMNISTKFQLHLSLWLLRRRFFNIFFANLALRLPWQPIRFSHLDKVHMVIRGLLKELFRKHFVKISAVR